MDEKTNLEEQLREAACIGDTDAVQELLNLGVNVNAKHAINGWTPLHWACKRNYLDVAALLIKHGADKNIQSDKGETPASISRNPYILNLLGCSKELPQILRDEETPSFVPNYIKNAPLNSKLDLELYKGNNNKCEELVLKLRIANSNDSDFIEVDLSCDALTYQNLINLCCNELDINPTQIVKLRKLPNTKIRRDKDVQRLENFQEIEVVLYSSINMGNDSTNKTMQYANGNVMPITPTNNYQSISKRDQTVLY